MAGISLYRQRSTRWTSATGYPFADRSPAATRLFRLLLCALLLWLASCTAVALGTAGTSRVGWGVLLAPYALCAPYCVLLRYLWGQRGRFPAWIYSIAFVSSAVMLSGGAFVYASLALARRG